MGIYQNKINGVGSSLEKILNEKLSKVQSISDKFKTLKINLEENKYKISISPSQGLDSIEAVFDYQENSGGYDEEGLKQARGLLTKMKLQQKGDDFYFSLEGYEVWEKDYKLHVKLTKKLQYDEKTLAKYIILCKIVFDSLIGEHKKTETSKIEPQKQSGALGCNTHEEVYAHIRQTLQKGYLKGGQVIEVVYRGKTIRVLLSGLDTNELWVQAMLNLGPQQYGSYKKLAIPVDKRFDLVGQIAGTCKQEVKLTDANTIIGVVERTLNACDYLLNNIPP